MKRHALGYSMLMLLPLLLLGGAGQTTRADRGGVQAYVKSVHTPFDSQKYVDPLINTTNTVRVNQPYQGGLFRTESRKEKMERFSCNQCHNNTEVKVPQAAEMAHGTIQLTHGGAQDPMDCFTCHKESNRDYLVSAKGLKIDMDHSYELCGQCHFRQHKDWVGGAHGKRIANWAGDRVVMNCTSCHDPHAPRFAKRWPQTYSPPLTD